MASGIKLGPSLITRREDFLSAFALSVAEHYLRCSWWRKLIADKVVCREQDAYLFQGREADYGFSFCPFCSKQVVLLPCMPGRLE